MLILVLGLAVCFLYWRIRAYGRVLLPVPAQEAMARDDPRPPSSKPDSVRPAQPRSASSAVAGLLIAVAVASGLVSVLAAALSPVVQSLNLLVPLARFNAVLALVALFLVPGDGGAGRQLAITRALRIATSALCVILVVHNIAGPELEGRYTSIVNPWGLPLVLAAFVVFQSHRGALRQLTTRRRWRSLVRTFGLVVFVVDVAVLVGAVPGNTAKARAGGGGVGLANLSTNETAFTACAVFVFALGLYMSGARRRKLDVVLAAAMFIVILLSQSRTGLFAAVLVTSIYAFRNRAGLAPTRRSRRVRRRRRLLTAGLAAVVIAGAPVVYDRTVTDAKYSQTRSATGSGRTTVWTEYREAFDRRMDDHGSVIFVGVGPTGIKALYDDTDLASRGLRAASVPFLPIHSDLIWLLLAGGLAGAAFVCAVVAWAMRHFAERTTPNIAVASGAALGLFVAFDQVQYVAGPCLLLMVGLFTLALDRDVPAQSSGNGTVPGDRRHWVVGSR